MATTERVTDAEIETLREIIRRWGVGQSHRPVYLAEVRHLLDALDAERSTRAAAQTADEATGLTVGVLLQQLQAERSTRAELEAARARLQTALDQATREREGAVSLLQAGDLVRARLEQRAQAAEAHAAAVAASLRIFVHAHDTGNSVPPHLVAQARTALAAPAGGLLDAVRAALAALDTASTWMQWWLDARECECPGTPHSCGRSDRERNLAEMRAAHARLAAALGEGP